MKQRNSTTSHAHRNRSALLSWATYYICQHPDVQEKAYQEVVEVLGSRDPTAEDIPKLRYVKAILEETLRLRPIVPMLPSRTTAEEGACVTIILTPPIVTILGKTFPKGTRVVLYLLPVHWSDKYWPNADKFMPERFLEGRERSHPFAYIPFSAGPRNCIGMYYYDLSDKQVQSLPSKKPLLSSL